MIPICDMGLSTRSVNALTDASGGPGVRTCGELAAYLVSHYAGPDIALMSVANLGRISQREILAKMDVIMPGWRKHDGHWPLHLSVGG